MVWGLASAGLETCCVVRGNEAQERSGHGLDRCAHVLLWTSPNGNPLRSESNPFAVFAVALNQMLGGFGRFGCKG